MDTKHYLTIGILASCALIISLTVSFAYFSANITHDNTNETGINSGSIGSIAYNGEKTFEGVDIYPGMKAVQTFTIEKGSQEGTGIYEIDLAGVVPEVFGNDIEITLYKTTDSVANNVVREEGELTQTSEGFVKEDTITITGTPEIVYGPTTFTNTSEIILEQSDFDTSTLQKTTYYLVYEYKNNGNQNAQQGQTFSGKVTVKLIARKQTFSDAIQACNDTAANCLNDNANLNTVELAYDGTADNNLRYIGADPNNYVSFNNELWRIIGVMNNIDDGTGNKETRIKLIRSESIGSYSWDNKASGTGSSTSSNGSNDWSDSALQIVLNEGVYWNRTSGECPSGQNGATTSCDFTNNGLTEEAKTMISDAKWNLGGLSSSSNIPLNFYTSERGTIVYSGRPTEWIGSIGLMYPSDYGYATSGGSSIDRETCLNTELYNWDDYDDCFNNDWLYTGSSQWTLTPYSGISIYVFLVYSNGNVDVNSAFGRSGVSPAIYLSSNVKISGGDGSSSSPFILSL